MASGAAGVAVVSSAMTTEVPQGATEEASKIEEITNSEAIFIQWRDYLDKVISDFKKK